MAQTAENKQCANEYDDLFMKKVCQKYPLSDNAGAARNWIKMGDGPIVPRPDCSLTTLTLLSVFMGVFGIDHFYLRSPLTGITKLATAGGFGLWWLWDILQLVCERERVLNYGMTTPFDMFTGIGQGMITDLKTNYTSENSYSLWLFGIIFGFIGIDSLIAKNGGQFLRKLMEFSLFVLCFVYVMKIFTTGITFGWIVSLICMCYLGSIIIAEYISVVTIVLGGDVFQTGVKVSPLEDKQYNSLFKWLVNAVNDYFLPKERKEQIIRDLQYGGIQAPDIKEMFEIYHMSENKNRAEAKQVKAETGSEEWGSWISFLVLIFSPIIILLSAIYSLFVMIWEATPWGRASKFANAVASGDLSKLGKMKGFKGLNTLAANPLAAVSNPLAAVSNPLAAVANPLAAAANPLAAVANPLAAVANPLAAAAKTKQTGGAKEDLSTESQIMGASIIALIAGGSLKGLVDYLMAE